MDNYNYNAKQADFGAMFDAMNESSEPETRQMKTSQTDTSEFKDRKSVV